MGSQMDEDDDELDLDLLESIALSKQSTPTAEMPRKKKAAAASITAPAVMMIVLFIVLFQNQTSNTFGEGTYSII